MEVFLYFKGLLVVSQGGEKKNLSTPLFQHEIKSRIVKNVFLVHLDLYKKALSVTCKNMSSVQFYRLHCWRLYDSLQILSSLFTIWIFF